MRRYELVALAACIGSVVAYFAGLLILWAGGGFWAAESVTFVVTVIALYIGWTMAGKQVR